MASISRLLTFEIPVRKYRAQVEIVDCPVFSEIERLALRAIRDDGANTIASLVNLFRLPKQLVLQMVVQLTKYAHIVVNIRDGSIEITRLGRHVVDNPNSLKPRETEEKIIEFFQECLTGSLTSTKISEMFVDRSLVKQSTKVKIFELEEIEAPPTYIVREFVRLDSDRKYINSLSLIQGHEEMIHPVLVRMQTEERYEVDERCVPKNWRTPIFEYISQKLPGSERAALSASDTEYSYDRKKPACVNQNYVNLVIGEIAHSSELEHAFKNAQNYIVIVSSFINVEWLISEQGDLIDRALKRGVKIEFIVGYETISEEDRRKWLKFLPRGKDIETLHCNYQAPAETHAKMLAYESKTGEHVLICGSYNWLTGQFNSSDVRTNVSVKVGRQKPFSEAFRLLIAVRKEEARKLGLDISSWADPLPSKIEFEEIRESYKADSAGNKERVLPISYVYAQDGIISDMLRSASQRCLVVSNNFNAYGISRLNAHGFGKKKTSNMQVVFENIVEPGVDLVEGFVRENLQRINRADHIHSKIIVSDNQVLVTSQNILSKRDRSQYGEMGVWLESKELADKLFELFQEKKGEKSRKNMGGV